MEWETGLCIPTSQHPDGKEDSKRSQMCVRQVDAHLFCAYKAWKYLKSSAYCNGKPWCCVNQRRDILLEDDGSGKTS